VARKKWGGGAQNKRVWGSEVPSSVVQGQSPGGVWERIPQMLETYAKSRTVKTSNKCNTRETQQTFTADISAVDTQITD